MNQYVLDASAVMRYLKRGPGFEKIAELLRKSSSNEIRLMISVVNRGEVLHGLARHAGIQDATASLRTLSACLEFVDVRQEEADAAAVLKVKYKLGFADCFAAELALRKSATLVTADPEFFKLGKQLKILALPRYTA